MTNENISLQTVQKATHHCMMLASEVVGLAEFSVEALENKGGASTDAVANTIETYTKSAQKATEKTSSLYAAIDSTYHDKGTKDQHLKQCSDNARAFNQKAKDALENIYKIRGEAGHRVNRVYLQTPPPTTVPPKT